MVEKLDKGELSMLLRCTGSRVGEKVNEVTETVNGLVGSGVTKQTLADAVTFAESGNMSVGGVVTVIDSGVSYQWSGLELVPVIYTQKSPSIPTLTSQTPPSVIGNGMVVSVYPSDTTLDGMYIIHPCVEGDKCIEQLYETGTGATANATNVGGRPNHRITTARQVACTVGNLNPFAQSGTITNDNSLGFTPWDTAAGRPSSLVVDTSSPQRYGKGTLGFGDRPLFKMESGAVLEYNVKDDFIINFYTEGTRSSDVSVETDTTTEGTYDNTETIDLSSESGLYRHPSTALSKVRITNNTSGACWVMGVNIQPLTEANPKGIYDSNVSWRYKKEGEDIPWIGPSSGSNTIAMRDSAGKLFCDYHGGHSNETVTLSASTEGKTPVIKTASDIVQYEFDYGSVITMRSVSTVTSGIPQEYSCDIKVKFFSGGNRVIAKIDAGENVEITDAYTGMTISNSRFTHLTDPIELDLSSTSEGDTTSLGAVSSATQNDPIAGHSIKTTTTFFSDTYSSQEGVWIATRAQDYKFYYAPLYQGGGNTQVIEFQTEHLYYS